MRQETRNKIKDERCMRQETIRNNIKKEKSWDKRQETRSNRKGA
jgi:hypothetical protein